VFEKTNTATAACSFKRLPKLHLRLESTKFDKSAFQDLNPLPKGWDDEIVPASTAQAGEEWINSQAPPLLRVPSVIVPGEFNYLLNPEHPDTPSLNTGAPQPFIFDTRLIS